VPVELLSVSVRAEVGARNQLHPCAFPRGQRLFGYGVGPTPARAHLNEVEVRLSLEDEIHLSVGTAPVPVDERVSVALKCLRCKLFAPPS